MSLRGNLTNSSREQKPEARAAVFVKGPGASTKPKKAQRQTPAELPPQKKGKKHSAENPRTMTSRGLRRGSEPSALPAAAKE